MVTVQWLLAICATTFVLILPGSLTYLVLSTRSDVPYWMTLLGSVIALPVCLVAYNILDGFYTKSRAKSLGAVVPPTVFDPSFAGVFTLAKIVGQLKDYPLSAFRQLSKIYGQTFQFQLPGGYKGIFTTEPEYIKAFLATQFDDFVLGNSRTNAFTPLLGDGVFNSDGELWKFHRNATRPYFSRERTSDLDNFNEHADVAISLAKERLSSGHPIDFQDLVGRFTLDSGTQFLFGDDVKSLAAGLPYSEKSNIPNTTEFVNHPSNSFVHAFIEGQRRVSVRANQGHLAPLLEVHGEQITPMRKIINPFVDSIVDRVIEKRKKADDHKTESTLLEYLLDFMDDPKAIKDEVLNMLVAGRDTTAGLLTFSVYALTQYPHILQRLREEVLEAVGPTAQPSLEVVREMKYLRAFLNETLRLFPPVSVNGRDAVRDTVLKSKNPDVPPLYVQKGTQILYSTLLMHRRTDLWGPDAQVFDPDRFLDDRVSKYLVPNPFIFLPFNAGPRICLGQIFAYNEASYFLIKLLQNFERFDLAEDAMPNWAKPPEEWKEVEGRQSQEKVIPSHYLTLSVTGGLWVRMWPSTKNTTG